MTMASDMRFISTPNVVSCDSHRPLTRRHGATEDERSVGLFNGRRATHADRRDVRARKCKPPMASWSGLHLWALTSRQAAFGGPSNASPASRLRGLWDPRDLCVARAKTLRSSPF